MVNFKEFMRFFREKIKHPHNATVPHDPDITSLISALGEQENIVDVDACITRLRVKVKDLSKVDTGEIQHLGAVGVVVIGQEIQAIFGRQSDNLRRELAERFGLEDK
ncbi:glucose PTS transporter subunit EIIB [Sodalis ligni]|jgi:PTS system glucose-specific IIB component|uniref:PTS system D-glucose-specific IIB component (Glc family) n=1 Tax=Sodalis ligni TaxID=2697027 RepID=A0A4V2Q2V9_9GAMM|nr:glucose PTS transporter subunit EIIB [Sodalis ligni]QWA12227.1 glucose PTS transporter subunit EIIB [Sodalis ligni]TCL04358.1 PTS system D-glucose-specific IIB component (Glc family) [Sodalis ligni]